MAEPALGPIYPILDGSRVPARLMPACARALADAGALIIQLRLKGATDRERLHAQRAVAPALAGTEVYLCVNDRPDLAAILAREAPPGVRPAVHLGQDDVPPASARQLLGDGVLIGLSTHDPGQLRAAASEPVDYLGFGPVYPTGSKASPDPVVGLDGLGAACAASALPIVAIGGIDAARAPAVLEAGASAAALISALYDGIDLEAAEGVSRLGRRFVELCGGEPA